MDPLHHDDKVAGVLWGVLAGETLGRPIDGWTRERIQREHGRVVRLLPGAAPGVLTATALRVAAWLADRRADPSEMAPHLATGGAGSVLVSALLAATIPAPASALGARAGRELARSAGSDDTVIEAAGIAAAAAARAFAEDPCLPVAADRWLEALRDECWSVESREALEPLAEFARRPPSPEEALQAFAALCEPLRELFLAIASLLVRRQSAETAVVWAVNLGGAASQRGALTAALAGLHRGASGLPERWTAGVSEARSLPGLARGMIDRRQRG